MNIEIKTWLYDILKAIEEIESFFTDTPKDFFAYQNNIKTKRPLSETSRSLAKR